MLLKSFFVRLTKKLIYHVLVATAKIFKRYSQLLQPS